MKRVHKATILDLSQHGIASSICLCWPDLISTLLGYPAETQIRLREPRPKRAKKAVRNPARRSSKSWEKAGHFVLWKKRANGDYVFKKKPAHIQAKGESFTALQPTCSSNTTSATSKLGCWAWGPALKWKAQGGLSHVRILVTSHYWDGFGYGPSHDSESGSQISDATKTTHLPLESGGYDFWRKSLKQKLHQVWELHSNPGLPNKNRARCSKKSAENLLQQTLKKNTKKRLWSW